ncbi:MAG: hypothetical protein A2V52_06955 [Actinobacteria bacterium RBG_19FT_COMBO_54_7]|uniref:Peptidase M28 domain-containing protein n=1 Tax=Candidatus Solincola sediminis TaxID=1797199 RepID=A0A1F2WM92_9ACTN|nr:MAG: hypothetical protein A2Y75_11885 [Candidatus Solincola sediminis]OFW58394.1 MAG: hypothetical protein A2W01_03100 [Candidatus Solincola sediminis]OFW69453.1 MAG: hypothetical protein A2V52_06955 [Actinobacteria bacterium RBG_19FT_COMBO_54_7]
MVASKYSDYMYGLLDRVMNEIGPRESCSEEEKALGRRLADELRPCCDSVEVEKFTCSPKAFLGFFPFLVIGYFAGVALYYVLPPISLIIAALCLGVLFFEVIRYHELIDPLFPRKEGENIIGRISPNGDVTRRVIVSAHLDSAYEFKIWYWFKGFSVAVMIVAFLAPLLLLGASLARTIADSNGIPDTTAYTVLGIILIALAPVVGIFAFFHSKDVVPGAMDNMAGVSVIAGLGKYLKDAGESGEYEPANTEVILLGASSEEAGLRGAKRYAARHRTEFSDLPTCGIFLDGICDEKCLSVFKREVWPGAKQDSRLIDLAVRAAEKSGMHMRAGILPVGATDASAFTRAGIPSVNICCQDNSKLPPNYHTRLDTIEYVRPESMVTALQVVIDMLKEIDA